MIEGLHYSNWKYLEKYSWQKAVIIFVLSIKQMAPLQVSCTCLESFPQGYPVETVVVTCTSQGPEPTTIFVLLYLDLAGG